MDEDMRWVKILGFPLDLWSAQERRLKMTDDEVASQLNAVVTTVKLQ